MAAGPLNPWAQVLQASQPFRYTPLLLQDLTTHLHACPCTGVGARGVSPAGLAMKPGDIAFKTNFATLDVDTGIVLSRRADRNFESVGPTLCAALDNLTIPGFPHHHVRVKSDTLRVPCPRAPTRRSTRSIHRGAATLWEGIPPRRGVSLPHAAASLRGACMSWVLGMHAGMG